MYIYILVSRGIWGTGWDDSYILIGNMNRGVDVISPVQRRTVMTLQSLEMSAIPSRFDAHPYEIGMLAGATSGGQPRRAEKVNDMQRKREEGE
ncbi:hypothetical protein GQ457_16G011560 [Hibiscus cannabinus]